MNIEKFKPSKELRWLLIFYSNNEVKNFTFIHDIRETFFSFSLLCKLTFLFLLYSLISDP